MNPIYHPSVNRPNILWAYTTTFCEHTLPHSVSINYHILRAYATTFCEHKLPHSASIHYHILWTYTTTLCGHTLPHSANIHYHIMWAYTTTLCGNTLPHSVSIHYHILWAYSTTFLTVQFYSSFCQLYSVSDYPNNTSLVYFLFGNSSASEFYMPTFRNTLSVQSS